MLLIFIVRSRWSSLKATDTQIEEQTQQIVAEYFQMAVHTQVKIAYPHSRSPGCYCYFPVDEVYLDHLG